MPACVSSSLSGSRQEGRNCLDKTHSFLRPVTPTWHSTSLHSHVHCNAEGLRDGPIPIRIGHQMPLKVNPDREASHPSSNSSGSFSVGACEMSQGWGWTCFQALQPFLSPMTCQSINTQTIPTNEPPHSCPLIIFTAFPFASKPSHILKQTRWHPGKPYTALWRNPSPCWASLLRPKSAGHASVLQPHSQLANIRAVYSAGTKLFSQWQMSLSFVVSITPFAHPVEAAVTSHAPLC